MLVISTIIYQQVHVPLTHSLLHSTKTDLAKIQFSNWPLHFTRHALSHFICLFLLEQAPLVGFWCFFARARSPGGFFVFFLLEQGPLVGEATLGWNSPAVQCQNAPRLFFQRHFARFPRAPLPLSFVAMQFAEQII